jgi:hypothetical protein
MLCKVREEKGKFTIKSNGSIESATDETSTPIKSISNSNSSGNTLFIARRVRVPL